jgi:hypothetical protein
MAIILCCNKRFTEDLLHNGRCPLCGKLVGIPDSLQFSSIKGKEILYNIEILYTEKETGLTKVVFKEDVSEAWYNKIKYTGRNVLQVNILSKKEI